MAGVLTKRENLRTDTTTGTSHEDEGGGGWGDTSTRKIIRCQQPPKARGRLRQHLSTGYQPALNLGLPASVLKVLLCSEPLCFGYFVEEALVNGQNHRLG